MRPARPTAATLERLAGALDDALSGRGVDKVWRPGPEILLVRFSRVAGRRLLLDVAPRHPRAVLTDRWPETPAAPDQATLRFRQALEGARVDRVRAWRQRGLVLDVTRRGETRALHVQIAGRYPNVAVLDEAGEAVVRLVPDRPPTDPDSPALPDGPCAHDDLEGDAWLVAVDASQREAADRRDLDARIASLGRAARTLRKRLRRTVRKVEEDLRRAEGAARHRHWGELLKTVLHATPTGAESVEVRDWADPEGGATEVPLDPALRPVENMERHFRLYRKYRDARERVEARWLDQSERLEAVEALLGDLDALRGFEGSSEEGRSRLEDLESRLRGLGWKERGGQRRDKRRDNRPAPPYRRFAAADGSAILVGRSSRHNDALTFRVGRGRDVWLHARDVPGSHVILRTEGRGEPAPEALLDAAALAAWHSDARDEEVVDVTWTERKHVRKPKGAAPGRVLVAAGRTLAVRRDPDRIARLYETLVEGR
ncbi:MAG: NFACT RNA binding domain-containing protein [Myxococcota bacterium]